MHSSDRTLLCKLGFQDADRQHPEHDLACAYLSTPACLEKLGKVAISAMKWPSLSRSYDIRDTDRGLPFMKSVPPDAPVGRVKEWSRCRVVGREVVLSSPVLEYHLTKGKDTYQTTIGFLDLFTEVNLVEILTGSRSVPERSSDRAREELNQHRESISGCPFSGRGPRCAIVEVKIEPVSVGDLLRQMKLYRTYVEASRGERRPPLCFVATRFELPAASVGIMKQEEIIPIRLGQHFDQYLSNLPKQQVEEF